MTSASSLAFPGSRTLAGWWRQLSPHHSLAFAVGYLFVHKVEAPVVVSRLRKIDRLALLVLKALELESAAAPAAPADPLSRLESCLHLDRQVLSQVLHGLQAEGLLDILGNCQATARGRQGLQHGHYFTEASERRAFHFLERPEPDGARRQPPHFVNLRGGGGTLWHVNARHPFDPAWLRGCLGLSDDWKQTHGFPVDVLQIPEPSTEAADESAWQGIIVDHPQQLLAGLVLAPDTDGPRLLGFAAQQEGWRLQATEPILAVDRGWQELFPEFSELVPETLTRSWQQWAQVRGLTEADAAACSLAVTGQRLRVEAAAPVAERLHAGRGEWLLAGEGYVRTALQVEVVSR
jgi:hypothetical protein